MSEETVSMKFEGEGDLPRFVEELNRRLTELEGQASKAAVGAAKMDGGVKKLTAAVSVGAVALKAYQFAMAGVADAMNNVMAAAKLEGVIRATGAAAGLTAQQLNAMSMELSSNSIHAFTAVQEAQSLLLTFREISGDVFPQAMNVISDMSMVFGSLESAAMQVGKALNDPAEGLAALSRVGVRFTDEQKKVIESMVAAGDAAGAQAVILGELEKKFGGVSKAIADTPAGKLKQLKNEYSDIRAELGEQLIPALVLLQKSLNVTSKLLVDSGAMYGAAVGGATLLAFKVVAFTKANTAATAAIIAKTKAMMANPLFLASFGAAAAVTAVASAVIWFGKSVEETEKPINTFTTKAQEAIDKFTALKKAISEDAEEQRRAALTPEQRALEDAKTANDKRVEELAVTHDQLLTNERNLVANLAPLYARRTQMEMELQGLMRQTSMRGVGNEGSYRLKELSANFNALTGEIGAFEGALSNTRNSLSEMTESATTQANTYGAKVKNITKASTDAAVAEANRLAAEREKLLRQMELDLMGSEARELGILEDTYKERAKLFRGNAEGMLQVDEWFLTQRGEIRNKYFEMEEKEHEEYIAAHLAREKAIADEIIALQRQIEGTQKSIMDKVTAHEVGQFEARRAMIRVRLSEELTWFEEGSEERVRIQRMAEAEIKKINDEELTDFKRKQDEMERIAWESWRRMMAPIEAWADAAVTSLNSVMSVFSALNSNKMKEVEAVSRKEIDAINASRMSNRAKAVEVERIEKEAAKARHSIAMSQWKQDLAMGAVNTAVAVTKTMTTVPWPVNIPLAIGQGVAGAAQIAVINANKPKMQFGGFVPGQSFSGDQVDVRLNSGEAVLNPAQQRQFMLLANGGGSGARSVSIGDTAIIINGNADASTVAAIEQMEDEKRRAIVEALYEAERRGEIDHSRLELA